MVDFGKRVKAAERAAKIPQNRKTGKKRGPPKGKSGNPATQFKPGVSGNAGGRPKKTPITDELRALLAELHPNQKKYPGKTRARVLAEKEYAQAEAGDFQSQREVTDRVEGKATQPVTLGGDGTGVPIEIATMTPEEKRRRVAEILAKASGTAN